MVFYFGGYIVFRWLTVTKRLYVQEQPVRSQLGPGCVLYGLQNGPDVGRRRPSHSAEPVAKPGHNHHHFPTWNG